MGWIVNPAFRRELEKTDDGFVYQKGWIVFKTSGGIVVPTEHDDVLTQMEQYVDIGDSWSLAKPAIRCKNIRADAREEVEIWDVTARYELEIERNTEEDQPDDFDEFMDRSQDDSADNPFRPRRSGGGTVIEEYFFYDLDNQPFVNSAFFPLQNIPPIPVTVQVDRITVNERNAADTSRIGRANGRKLLADVTYEEADHENRRTGATTRYYRNTYERWTHPYRDWKNVECLDSGFIQLINLGGGVFEVANIVDEKTKEPIAEAAMLDGQGGVLPRGQQPIKRTFRVRNEGPLGIPFLGD